MNNKTLRVLITTKCNLKCEYCCNKLPDVQARFKMSTYDQVVESNYSNYCISGGEPTINPEYLLKFLKEIKKNNKEANIYLYTNGHKFPKIAKELSRLVTAINFGIHSQPIIVLRDYQDLCEKHKIPFRFYCNEDDLTKYNSRLSNLHSWKLDDCFNNVNEEDWLII